MKKSKTIENQLKNKLTVEETHSTESVISVGGHIISGRESYTKNEILVLKQSSLINHVEYLPFLAQIDLREKFFTITEFCDADGLPPLSRKQKDIFVNFRRLSELSSEPCIFSNTKSIDCFSIKQTIVSDCSVIASLTVSALYERRFSRKLISNIIYPQNRNGEPVYNPCGKYMVKLNLNGISRKVCWKSNFIF